LQLKNLRWYLSDVSLGLRNSGLEILNDIIMRFYGSYVGMRYHNILKRNARFKDIYSEDDRCFIVGNGPSLAKQDLSPLAGEHVFVMNWFYQHKQFREISPEYYTFISPFAFTDYKSYDNYGMYSKFSELWRGLDEALTKTRRKTNLFLLLNQMEFVSKNNFFKQADMYYLLPFLTIKHGIRRVDLTGATYGIGTAPFSMLLAYYMGFKNIFLIGCDCSWAADCSEEKHFYSAKFYPESKYEQMLKDTLELFACYRIIGNFLTSKGCKVYDATEGGFLDIFPKVKYEQLFK